MIGKLKGVVDSYGEDFVILDVQGVGYVVHCSARTLQRLPKPGEAAALSIETHVREDMIRLYGFRSDPERRVVPPAPDRAGRRRPRRAGRALGPGAGPARLRHRARRQDRDRRAPGVGPRLAARLVAELKDKAPAFAPIDPALIALSGAVESRTAPQPVADAISALVNLGYAQLQASAAIAAALKSAGDGAEAKVLIRLGLRELAQ